MATCGVCGEELVRPYHCSHCGRPVCESHRLPENHGCDAPTSTVPLADRKRPAPGSEGIESPEPMDTDERHRAGTRVDPTFERSPDVDPDGSVSTTDGAEGEDADDSDGSSVGILGRLRSLLAG